MDSSPESLTKITAIPISISFDRLARAYLEDYDLQRFRSLVTAKQRVEHLRRHFGLKHASELTPDDIRQYQLQRRQAGAAAATVNRETSALKRMFQLAYQRGLAVHIPMFPTRLRENPQRQGFFEHDEYVKVRAQLPAPYQTCWISRITQDGDAAKSGC